MTDVKELRRRTIRVTGETELPRIVDCMCNGECHRRGPDIYKLWHTLEALETKSSKLPPEELIRRLDGVLKYYEDKGEILQSNGYGILAMYNFNTQQITETYPDGRVRVVQMEVLQNGELKYVQELSNSRP